MTATKVLRDIIKIDDENMLTGNLESKIMAQNFAVELATNDFKEVERQIIDFYLRIARRSNIDLKQSKIFAYLKIYKSLTQKQLQELTNLSSGFVSITLKSFLQSSIVTRDFLPGTHTNIYTINEEYGFTFNAPTAQVNRVLEEHDIFIKNLQEKLKKYREKYPKEAIFLERRLNGIRNYIEIQRMVHTNKKAVFLNENTFDLVLSDEFINYPPEIIELENQLVERFVRMNMFIRDDPIINKILTFLITREKMSQEMLLRLTGFSRSTISRNLKGYGEQDYVTITKKEYLKPRIYYIGSIGIYLAEVLLIGRQLVISQSLSFEELLLKLKSDSKFKKNVELNAFFISKLEQIISDINQVKNRAKRLEIAQQELKQFNSEKEKRKDN